MFSVLIMLFSGAVFVLYSLTVAGSAVYPRWLRWVAFWGGVGSLLVGFTIGYNGPTSAIFAVFRVTTRGSQTQRRMFQAP